MRRATILGMALVASAHGGALAQTPPEGTIPQAQVLGTADFSGAFKAFREGWARREIESRRRQLIERETDPRIVRAAIPLSDAYVKRVVGRLAARARLPAAPAFAVFLNNSSRDLPNARMEAGVLRVSRELILLLDSEDEIAAVLAHELAHLELGHDLEALLAAGRFHGSAGGGIFSSGDRPNDKILALKRKHEFEADARGLEIQAAAGYDPSAAPDALRKIAAKLREPQYEIYTRGSDHPDDAQRLERLLAHTAELRLRPRPRTTAGLGKAKKEIESSFDAAGR